MCRNTYLILVKHFSQNSVVLYSFIPIWRIKNIVSDDWRESDMHKDCPFLHRLFQTLFQLSSMYYLLMVSSQWPYSSRSENIISWSGPFPIVRSQILTKVLEEHPQLLWEQNCVPVAFFSPTFTPTNTVGLWVCGPSTPSEICDDKVCCCKPVVSQQSVNKIIAGRLNLCFFSVHWRGGPPSLPRL